MPPRFELKKKNKPHWICLYYSVNLDHPTLTPQASLILEDHFAPRKFPEFFIICSNIEVALSWKFSSSSNSSLKVSALNCFSFSLIDLKRQHQTGNTFLDSTYYGSLVVTGFKQALALAFLVYTLLGSPS